MSRRKIRTLILAVLSLPDVLAPPVWWQDDLKRR
jgi:hypothetical protein